LSFCFYFTFGAKAGFFKETTNNFIF